MPPISLIPGLPVAFANISYHTCMSHVALCCHFALALYLPRERTCLLLAICSLCYLPFNKCWLDVFLMLLLTCCLQAHGLETNARRRAGYMRTGGLQPAPSCYCGGALPGHSSGKCRNRFSGSGPRMLSLKTTLLSRKRVRKEYIEMPQHH